MLIDMPKYWVRQQAIKAGVLGAVSIRTGEAAAKKEHRYVDDDQCSVLIATCHPNVEGFINSIQHLAVNRG
jgi:hypothetical protein